MTSPARAGPETPHVFSVGELNRTVRDLLESGLGTIRVEGEVSNLARPASGHIYFSLKDRDAQVRCALFRNRRTSFQPEAGDRVHVQAQVSLYEARGEYQLIVDQIEPAGAGDLAQAFEALKRKLHAEGLFDTARKRDIPTLPHRIGILTSATGAALRDVLQVLGRRCPAVPVVVYPVAVQGERAAPEIVRMFTRAAARAECDLLLLVRGGGSLEDLQAFNEEAVARAIAACPIPVIAGVGHEIDVTIADFVADQRAPTPSAAAELAVPDAATLLHQTAGRRERLRTAMRNALTRRAHQFDGLQHRLRQQHPERRLQQLQQRRDELELALTRTPQHWLRRRQDRLAMLARALDAVSPLNTLGRGYALVRRVEDGRPVTDSAAVQIGERVDIHLARGRLSALVEQQEIPEGSEND